MSDTKQPIGMLFGRISYYKETDIENIISTMEFPQAFYMLSQALEYANSSGLFSLQEAEIASKSLRMMSNNSIEELN